MQRDFYRSRMRRGNTFGRVCLSVCPVRALTFENLDLEISYLVRMYIFRIFSPSLYAKDIGEGRSYSSKTGCLCILLAGTIYDFGALPYGPLHYSALGHTAFLVGNKAFFEVRHFRRIFTKFAEPVECETLRLLYCLHIFLISVPQKLAPF